MNPEFRRNLWLELTPRRLLLWAVLLALAFFASALAERNLTSPADLARFLFYIMVVFWGTRNAALSVVGEIRERTWDAQRLSSIGAAEMSWGKLFGATSFNWYAGAICLVLVLAGDASAKGAAAAAVDLAYFIEIGLISQASALFASLIAVRRRQNHSRGEIFLYQLVGLVAAFAVYLVWELADPAGSLIQGLHRTVNIAWWGRSFDYRVFLLVSLGLFTAWLLIGCWRLMRVELKLTNGPFVWLAFLMFVCAYTSGFDGRLAAVNAITGADVLALRLGVATLTAAALTYVTVVLEPKDRVHLRWLGAQLASGRIDKFFFGVQPFMVSYAVTVFLTLGLLWWRFQTGSSHPAGMLMLVAGLGFLTRDIGLFLLVHAARGRARADMSAVLLLVALYVLLPAIVNSLQATAGLVLFYPQQSQPLWLSPAVAWAEALIVAVLAFGRIALPEKPAAQVALASS